MKRLISLSLVFTIFLTLLFLNPTEAKAYDEPYPLPILTGDMPLDVARIAESQLGYSYKDGTAYGAWWSTVTNWGYDYTRLDWCAMFACWCATQAGAGMNVAYSIDGAKASMLFQWQKENCFYDTTLTATPQPGDFMYFGGSDFVPNHVAIVTSYDSQTQTVYMVGGNQGNSPGTVTTTTCPWYPGAMRGSKYVLGLGRPNYAAKDGCSPHQYAKGVYVPETSEAPAMNTYTCNLCGFVLEKPVGVKSGTCGEKVFWNLDETGTLIIYGTGPMTNYRLSDYATPTSPFFGLSDIRQVKIKSGVTSVGDYAFFRHTGVQTLVLPAGLTAIGRESFSGCTALGAAELPNGLLSIGAHAFNCCDSLTAVTIPDSVTDVGEGAFLRCRSLTEAVLGAGVTRVEASTFSGCFSLKTVTLHFGITQILDSAFSGCGQLQSIRYLGSQAQWKATRIGAENERLKTANVQFLSLQGWLQTGQNWYYYHNGKKVTGWLKYGPEWYYFYPDGRMLVGWLYYGGQWYYFNEIGRMHTGWAQDGGQWYYLDENGHMVKGWCLLNGTWYYFKPSGNMATGWIKEGSTWYYLKPSGAMQTGWLRYGSVWYYFRSNGMMVTGQLQLGGKTYQFDGSGICLNP